jgi:hypothetical protein
LYRRSYIFLKLTLSQASASQSSPKRSLAAWRRKVGFPVVSSY